MHCIQTLHVGSSKSVIVGMFIPWKMIHSTNQGIPLHHLPQILGFFCVCVCVSFEELAVKDFSTGPFKEVNIFIRIPEYATKED